MKVTPREILKYSGIAIILAIPLSAIMPIISFMVLGINRFDDTYIALMPVMLILAIYCIYFSRCKGAIEVLIKRSRNIAFLISQITIIISTIYCTTTFYDNSNETVTAILETSSIILFIASLVTFSVYKILSLTLVKKMDIEQMEH